MKELVFIFHCFAFLVEGAIGGGGDDGASAGAVAWILVWLMLGWVGLPFVFVFLFYLFLLIFSLFYWGNIKLQFYPFKMNQNAIKLIFFD